MLLDIDRFKSINDTLGHKAGDDVIVAVAQVLKDLLGEDAMVARIGGEEFAVLLTGAEAGTGPEVAEAIRRAVEESGFEAAGRAVRITVSGGLSEGVAESGFSELFSGADRALYLAKAAGRNRIVRAREFAETSVAASFSNDGHRSGDGSRLSAQLTHNSSFFYRISFLSTFPQVVLWHLRRSPLSAS